MDSCSKLPLCSDMVASNCMSMSSSWCGVGLVIPTCFFCMFDVVLLLVAPVGGALFPWCGHSIFFSYKSC